jgi:hypothetical protein
VNKSAVRYVTKSKCEFEIALKVKLQKWLIGNKHSSKISQETLLNSVSIEMLPFKVGEKHDSFTLMSVKDVMVFQHCQHAIHLVCTGYR